MNKRVLHITVHMGGGIGNAVSSIVCEDKINNNYIVVLQKPDKWQYVNLCIENGIEILVEPTKNEIVEAINNSDIVVIHWWNHPLMNQFLYSFSDCLIRSVLWCHVSGLTYPYLPIEFINCFDYTFFTSQCSYDNIFWGLEEKKAIHSKSRVIYGMGPISEFKKKENYSVDEVIKVGYVGTLTRSKISPDFVFLCKKILEKVDNAVFELCGDKEDGKWIIDEAEKAGIKDRIKLLGYVDDIPNQLLKFDIFGYPLNKYNYATTENALLEAMAAGLPIVAMDQGTEKYILNHNINGILCKDDLQYILEMTSMAGDLTQRRKIGTQASEDVFHKFDFNQNLNNYLDALEMIFSMKKSRFCVKEVLGDSPFEWFRTFVNYNDILLLDSKSYSELEYIFKEKSKSSVFQYAFYFPEDDGLRKITKEMELYG